MSSLADRILALPKAELHVHLRGAMPVDVLVALFNRHPPAQTLVDAPRGHRALFQGCPNVRPLLGRDWIATDDAVRLFQYDTFDQFLETYCFTSYLVRDAADLRLLIREVTGDLRRQSVVYAEITVSVVEYLWQGISLEEIGTCLDEGARADGIRVRWIVDLVRDIGPAEASRLLARVIDLQCPGIAGITLGGSEDGFPPAQFADVYALARDHGLRLTVHAGEALGPQSVWDALRILGAERIGHGIRAVEDPELVAYLAEHRVPLEVCPTSNVCTGVVESYDAHPVRALYEAGVPITISTDDPAFFHTTLTGEFVRLREMGFSEAELLELIDGGFRHACYVEACQGQLLGTGRA